MFGLLIAFILLGSLAIALYLKKHPVNYTLDTKLFKFSVKTNKNKD